MYWKKGMSNNFFSHISKKLIAHYYSTISCNMKPPRHGKIYPTKEYIIFNLLMMKMRIGPLNLLLNA
ncbi:hypothetical protein HZS_1317 [Henneguya salminicola]|nr:hypothetical protein HZS_1317 [Henneguya salminicola]